MTTLERVKGRLYFRGAPFASKDAIKRIGGHFDFDAKCWWIGVAKVADAEALVAELNAPAQPQFAGAVATTVSARVAASVGLSPDTPAGIVADAVEEAGDARKAADLRKTVEDVSDCRVYAKVAYKGRTYYVIGRTMNDRHQPVRVRLATMQEDGPVFWADASACALLKEYPGRKKWDGRRYSNREVTVYTTLGSLREFVVSQKNPDTARQQCMECGSWFGAGEQCRDCGGC